eukprot:892112-Pyramimonas_sp.AAC.1
MRFDQQQAKPADSGVEWRLQRQLLRPGGSRDDRGLGGATCSCRGWRKHAPHYSAQRCMELPSPTTPCPPQSRLVYEMPRGSDATETVTTGAPRSTWFGARAVRGATSSAHLAQARHVLLYPIRSGAGVATLMLSVGITYPDIHVRNGYWQGYQGRPLLAVDDQASFERAGPAAHGALRQRR